MKKDKVAMKILEIRDNGGYFRVSEDEEWRQIDKIDKVALLALLNAFLGSDVEMDPPEETKLQNQAQQIIYRSIYEKFSSLQENKSKFKDESDRKYLKELQKYSERIVSDESDPEQ